MNYLDTFGDKPQCLSLGNQSRKPFGLKKSEGLVALSVNTEYTKSQSREQAPMLAIGVYECVDKVWLAMIKYLKYLNNLKYPKNLNYLKYGKDLFNPGFREIARGKPKNIFLLGKDRKGTQGQENSNGKLPLLD